ncbi:UNVERIFIED_CONTAM: hypothetical protein Sradi_0732200 [Sesamum radiatum]|uniref:Uncharacterized protein n=1 Tax=Sesamum radiatum TaxID=300843 RepID=A0AAW2VPB6_SESRA
MRGALLRNFPLYIRGLHLSRNSQPYSVVSNAYPNYCCRNYVGGNAPASVKLFPSWMRFFSSENGSPEADSNPENQAVVTQPEEKKEVAADVGDVNNKGSTYNI